MTALEMRQRVWRLVTNRSLSTWLLVVVTAVLVMGALLPNPEYMGADAIAMLKARNPLLLEIGTRFNSRKLATGYLFGGIGIYLMLSATLCSIDRLLKRRQDQNPDPVVGVAAAEVSMLVPAASPEEVAGFLTGILRHRLPGAAITLDPAAHAVIFQRGRYGFWGSLLFHSVLITALFGVVLFYLGGTRGKLVFTEGQRYRLERSRFISLEKEPVWGLRLPQVELELLTQYSLYDHDNPQTAIEHLARFRVTDLQGGGSVVRDVRINSPLRLDGTDFLLMTGGFAPRFVVSRQDKVLYDSLVNLRQEAGTRDDFVAADGMQVAVRFFPELALEQGKPVTKSLLLNNPAAHITVTRQGEKLYEGMVPVGSRVPLAGYEIAIPEVRRWVELEMADEPGIGFFFAISFLGILGILIRMLDPDDRLVLVMHPTEAGTQVSIYPSSRHFAALLAGVARDSAQAAVTWGENRVKGTTQ